MTPFFEIQASESEKKQPSPHWSDVRSGWESSKTSIAAGFGTFFFSRAELGRVTCKTIWRQPIQVHQTLKRTMPCKPQALLPRLRGPQSAGSHDLTHLPCRCMHHEATARFLRTRFAILERNPRTSRRSKSSKRKPREVGARWSEGSGGASVADAARCSAVQRLSWRAKSP